MLWALAAFCARDGRRGARARRAERPAAADADPRRRTLVALAVVSLAGALAIGVGAAIAWGYGLLVFVAVGAFLVPAYNLELFGGRFHTDLVVRARLGRVPRADRLLRRGADASRSRRSLAAAYATALSLAQRRLSTPVRHARRTLGDDDGNRAARARAARADVGGASLLAVALVAARLT